MTRKQKRPGRKGVDLQAELAALKVEIASLAYIVRQARDAAICSNVGTDRILSELRD